MKYVDWLEQVLQGLMAAVAADPQARLVGVRFSTLQQQLTGDASAESPAAVALGDAVRDLERLGLASMRNRGSVELTQNGKELANQSLRSTWPTIQQLYVDAEQLAVLRTAAELCEERHPDYALLREVTWQEVFARLDWPAGDSTVAYDITAKLEEAGLLARRARLGNAIDLYPTYVGVVRATESEQADQRRLVADLLPEWETTTVEFKLELNLKRDKEKAEFVRDVLALATTKASGRRWLVIGFDPKTHQFAKSADPTITQDRLEQILNAYAVPAPEIRYQRVRWNGGDVGLVEVRRDPARIPYRVVKALAHIKVGDMYVRHGSQVEPPTPAERVALEAEGRAARGEPPATP
jgi:Putative DNA-binding domain